MTTGSNEEQSSQASANLSSGNADVGAEQSVPTSSPHSPEDVAATMFHTFLPRLKHTVLKLSNKQLRRILIAVVESPLHDQPLELKTKEEKLAFYDALQLIEAKYIMVAATYAEKLDQESKKEEKNDG